MQKCKRFLLRLAVISLVLATMLSCLTASAESIRYEELPCTSYTYWTGYSQKKVVPTRPLFSVKKVVNIYGLTNDTASTYDYMCCDKKGNTYLLDGGIGCIYVFNNKYELVEKFTSINYNGEELTFVGAKGIYLDDDGVLYVCDTKNNRVICKGTDGSSWLITRPVSSVIPEDFAYAPTRVVKDGNDFTYVLCDGSYYGLMVFNEKYEFMGFFGASLVTTDVLSAIKDWITSIFETRAKHEASVQELPYQLTDIAMSSSGFVCGSTGETTGQIRMFAPTGSNILRAANQFSAVDGDKFNFGDNPTSFVPVTEAWGMPWKQNVTSVTADKNGYLYCVDSMQGRVYMYDEYCNLITVFGGGTSAGSQVGSFYTANQIAANGDDILVLDFVNKNITVFTINDFGKKLITAQNYTNAGEYAASKPYWEYVNSVDKNCQLAYVGLAKAAIAEEDYKNAMSFAKSGLDQSTYSQAYKVVRNDFIYGNIGYIVAIGVLLAAAIVTISVLKRKGKVTLKMPEKLGVCLGTCFRPIETFNAIRLKNQGSVLYATILLLLFYLGNISKVLFGGFMYNMVDLSTFNSIYTFLGSTGLVLLFVIVNWGACILFEGKGKLKEIYCSACYCLQPMIIYSILFVVLSYVVIPSTNNGFSLINTLFTGMFVIWLLLSITVIHDFSFFKAIGLGLIILLGMGIVLFVLFIMLTLGQDLLGFVFGVINEAILG